MAIAEVSIVPIGTKTPSVSKYVTKVLDVLERDGVKYELTAMGTIIEGDVENILSLVRKMHEAAFGEEASRIVTTVKIDDRRDKVTSAAYKIESVKQKLSKIHKR